MADSRCKSIFAGQNPDGTYRVEIRGWDEQESGEGYGRIIEKVSFLRVLNRATIHFVSLNETENAPDETITFEIREN